MESEKINFFDMGKQMSSERIRQVKLSQFSDFLERVDNTKTFLDQRLLRLMQSRV